MDFRRLDHLVALADKRNFARASEQVNLSQPALTRSIQAAEAEFGMRLFDRGAVAVTPTPAGEFVARAGAPARLREPLPDARRRASTAIARSATRRSASARSRQRRSWRRSSPTCGASFPASTCASR